MMRPLLLASRLPSARLRSLQVRGVFTVIPSSAWNSQARNIAGGRGGQVRVELKGR
jgi:hypothetical protein